MKKIIKNKIIPILLIGGSLVLLTACQKTNETEKIIANMTLRENIGQKMVMSFRYWCESDVDAKFSMTGFFVLSVAIVS